MIEDLLDIAQLMPLLGYSDPRSIIKWCKSKNIPIIKVGIKKYVLSHYSTQYIDNQLITFERAIESVTILSKKLSEKTSEKTNKKYKPENEIVNKYLSRYETDAKPKTTL